VLRDGTKGTRRIKMPETKLPKDNKVHVDMFSAVSFKPEEIEFFLDQIADRIWNRMLEWNSKYREELSEKSDAPEVKCDRPKATAQPHRRRREKRLIVNGEFMAFRSAKAIFRCFAIDMKRYEKFERVSEFKNGDNVVEIEANAIRNIMTMYGHSLTSYTAYGFDGKPHTINFSEEQK
jgi:hypothetical protein